MEEEAEEEETRQVRSADSAGRGCSILPAPAGFDSAIGGQRPQAEPGGQIFAPAAQKSARYCRAHWSPGQRAAFPAPASWVLGILVCFGSLAFTSHWILHTSVSPTSTPCPHAPAPATGKNCCVFSCLALARCLCVCRGVDSGHRPFPCPVPLLQRWPAVRLLERSPTLQSPRSCLIVYAPEHPQELKILRHAWNS